MIIIDWLMSGIRAVVLLAVTNHRNVSVVVSTLKWHLNMHVKITCLLAACSHFHNMTPVTWGRPTWQVTPANSDSSSWHQHVPQWPSTVLHEGLPTLPVSQSARRLTGIYSHRNITFSTRNYSVVCARKLVQLIRNSNFVQILSICFTYHRHRSYKRCVYSRLENSH